MDFNNIQQQRAKRLTELKNRLPYFASQCLTIKDKSGALVPFNFNRAQKYTHQRLEEQKERTGKVRALL